MNLKIKKAKLVKGENLQISYDKTADNGRKSFIDGEVFDDPVHPDLITTFEKMNVHLALMCGYINPVKFKDLAAIPELKYDGFHARSYSYGGTDKNPGITISGHYKLPNSKAQILPSPFYLFDENEETRYPFMDELIETLKSLDTEVLSYVDGSKRGTDGQLTIFDEKKNEEIIKKKEAKNKVTKMQIVDPEETKVPVGIIPPADPDAMERVKTLNTDGVEEAHQVTEKPNGGRPKKVKQTAENPSGEVHE